MEKILRLTDSLYLFAPDSIQATIVWKEGQQLDNSEKAKRQEQVEKRPANETDKKRL